MVALELTAEERNIAGVAWETHREVFTRGTLDRRFRPYRLIRPEAFEMT